MQQHRGPEAPSSALGLELLVKASSGKAAVRRSLLAIWRRLLSPLLLGAANLERLSHKAARIFTSFRRKDSVLLFIHRNFAGYPDLAGWLD